MVQLSKLFAPKEREFFDLFEEAGANIVRAAELLERLVLEWPDSNELSRDIVVCEQEGDRITHDIIQRLNQTFVTPIDREDIYALASGLDDIVDWIEEVADFFALYRIEAPMSQAQQQAKILSASCRQVAQAIPRLRGFEDIHHFTVEINRYENEGDRVRARGPRVAVPGGDRPHARDPLEGHLRAARGCHRRDGARGQHPRGHHDQEHLVVDSDIVLWIVVATALAFDFTNGFHDTANAVATSISTRALSPRLAVTHGGDPELRRRVHLARGGGHDRQGDRQRRRR